MLKHPDFDPIAISLGEIAGVSLDVRWYGLMYLLGFSGAWWLGRLRAKHDASWNAEQVSDLIFFGAVGVILGGRMGYTLFYGMEGFLQDPLSIIRVWEGGMSFHGGLLGVLVAMLWFGRKYGKTFFQVTDFLAPLVPIGLGLGRLGNFLNGELYGRVTDVPWAMEFANQGYGRHPSQLYQMALEGVALFCILWLFSGKPRPKMAVSGLFLICYGCFRFFVEFFREPDAHIGLALHWISRGQVLSVPMIAAGIVMMVWAYRKLSKTPSQGEQTP